MWLVSLLLFVGSPKESAIPAGEKPIEIKRLLYCLF
jgi:hypothetical protein